MADELPDLSKLTLTEKETPKTSRKGYTHRSSGTDKAGNHYCLRDYGPNILNKYPYHYSNTDGSFGYSNPDGSKYHENQEGKGWYEPVPGVNLSRDSKDGQWIRQPGKGQPGMSSDGLKDLHQLIGSKFSVIGGCSQSEGDCHETEHEHIGSVPLSGSAESPLTGGEAYNDGHHEQKDRYYVDEVSEESTADDANRRYNGGDVKGQNESGHGFRNARYENNIKHESDTGCQHAIGYGGSNAYGYKVEYTHDNENSYETGYGVDDGYNDDGHGHEDTCSNSGHDDSGYEYY